MISKQMFCCQPNVRLEVTLKDPDGGGGGGGVTVG